MVFFGEVQQPHKHNHNSYVYIKYRPLWVRVAEIVVRLVSLCLALCMGFGLVALCAGRGSYLYWGLRQAGSNLPTEAEVSFLQSAESM